MFGEPRLVMEWMFRYMGDATTFTEGRTVQRRWRWRQDINEWKQPTGRMRREPGEELLITRRRKTYWKLTGK